VTLGCNCRKKKSNDSRAVSAASSLTYQVWRNGTYTGRSFTSLVQATRYAKKVQGEVVTA